MVRKSEIVNAAKSAVSAHSGFRMTFVHVCMEAYVHLSRYRTRPRLQLQLRGGNHRRWGACTRKTRPHNGNLGCPTRHTASFRYRRRAHPMRPKWDPNWPKTGPNRRWKVHSRVLQGPKPAPCMSARPQSVTGPDVGPLNGTVSSRFGPFSERFAHFWCCFTGGNPPPPPPPSQAQQTPFHRF